MSPLAIMGAALFVGALVYAALQVQNAPLAVGVSAMDAGGGVMGSAAGGPDGSDADTLARTIYGEARNQSAAGWQGVASVVMNRFNAGPLYGWPGSVAGVCLQKNQFDCWNAGDPNLPVVQGVDTSDPLFAQMLALANDAIAGALTDNTGGADFYHDTSIATPQSWLNAGYQRTAHIGRLVFFKSP